LRTVDLFCGAGGSSAGARLAGAEIVGAIDADPIAAKTFKANFPDAKVVTGRLNRSNGVRLLGDVGRVDLLLASPECTNHSVARGAKEVDPVSLRSGLFIFPFLKEWQPKFLVLENVSRMRRWEGWPRFLERLGEAGYEHSVHMLEAQKFGVPQSRRRMFLMASRDGTPPEEVAATVRKPRTAAGILDRSGTYIAKSVTGRKRPLAEATVDRIKRGRKGSPDGEDFIIVYYGSDAAGGWQPLDRPLRTLTTLDRFGLVSGTGRDATLRMLQVPELKRAMGFPTDYLFDQGTRRDRIRLLGNGVCPPVMEAVVRALTAESQQAQAISTELQRAA
jgi:DNA (cytosine-5)-methyltransferase 1